MARSLCLPARLLNLLDYTKKKAWEKKKNAEQKTEQKTGGMGKRDDSGLSFVVGSDEDDDAGSQKPR